MQKKQKIGMTEGQKQYLSETDKCSYYNQEAR